MIPLHQQPSSNIVTMAAAEALSGTPPTEFSESQPTSLEIGLVNNMPDAAVLHLDGIARLPYSDKRFGVFASTLVSDHPLMASAPRQLLMPHSRWNDIPEEAVSAGYHVLTRSAEAGIDTFVKQRKSLF